MGIDELITLEDGKEYVLLFESNKDNNKYFLAAEMKEGQPTEVYEIFKQIEDAEGFSVEEVSDVTLKDELITDFENQYDKEDE